MRILFWENSLLLHADVINFNLQFIYNWDLYEPVDNAANTLSEEELHQFLRSENWLGDETSGEIRLLWPPHCAFIFYLSCNEEIKLIPNNILEFFSPWSDVVMKCNNLIRHEILLRTAEVLKGEHTAKLCYLVVRCDEVISACYTHYWIMPETVCDDACSQVGGFHY